MFFIYRGISQLLSITPNEPPLQPLNQERKRKAHDEAVQSEVAKQSKISATDDTPRYRRASYLIAGTATETMPQASPSRPSQTGYLLKKSLVPSPGAEISARLASPEKIRTLAEVQLLKQKERDIIIETQGRLLAAGKYEETAHLKPHISELNDIIRASAPHQRTTKPKPKAKEPVRTWASSAAIEPGVDDLPDFVDDETVSTPSSSKPTSCERQRGNQSTPPLLSSHLPAPARRPSGPVSVRPFLKNGRVDPTSAGANSCPKIPGTFR